MRQHDEHLSPAEERARQAVRSLPALAAESSFRQKLRDEFVSGRLSAPDGLADRASDGLADQASDGAADWAGGPAGKPAPDGSPLDRFLGWLKARPLLIPAAVAAAVVAAVLLRSVFAPDVQSQWTLRTAEGEGRVWIDGRFLATEEVVQQEVALLEGQSVRVEGELVLDYQLGELAYMQIPPGAEFTVPGQVRGKTYELRGGVLEGEVRFVTGPELTGGRLLLDTPVAQVEVLGTALAVLCSPDTTCVCLWKGTARMIDNSGQVSPVEVGTRRTLYADGRPSVVEEIQGMEAMKLSMLWDRARQVYGEE